MNTDFLINGVKIKHPSSFKREPYNLTNMDRLGNGDMAGDLIAFKWKYYFTFEAMTGAELDNILDAVFNHRKLFFPIVYPYNGIRLESMVYVGSIPHELHRAGMHKDWVWKNVSFNLIER